MPAEAPKAEPAAKDPLDSLFGDLPKEPATEPAMPADRRPRQPDAGAPEAAPKAEPAKENLDDLFGPPAAKPEMPAAPEAAPAAEPAKASLDDLFGPPAAKPEMPAAPEAAPAAEPAKANLDDLFGPPAAKPEAAPKVQPKAAPAADPFSSLQREPAELTMRTWVDNTGSFRVTAKLVEVLDGKVRLLKDSGKTTTVELGRLSETDVQYVQTLLAQQGSGVVGQLAAR